MKTIIVVAAVLASLAAPRADAAQVFATSYAMPNGGGQASGGTFNYWDKEYTGAGAVSTDGAALTGGLGNLTDGVVAPNLWFNTENNAGTGPYVGWYGPGRGQLNPLITFNFAGSTLIDQIRIHMDNSNLGGGFCADPNPDRWCQHGLHRACGRDGRLCRFQRSQPFWRIAHASVQSGFRRQQLDLPE